MPTEVSETMMRKRERDTNTHADIHERDMAYLRVCRDAGRQAAARNNWKVVHCAKNGIMRCVEDIHHEIYGLVCACLWE